MIKAIIFDLNGVFVKGEYLSERIAQAYGVNQKDFLSSLKQVMAIVRKPGVANAFQIWEPHLRKLGLNFSKDEFFHFWFSGEIVDQQMVKLANEMREQELKVFILSNNFKERTEYYRQHFPLVFNSVDKAYFSWETGYVKPDPKAYQLVLNENKVEGSECAYFDDSFANIDVAKELGIVTYPFQDPETTKNIMVNLLGNK